MRQPLESLLSVDFKVKENKLKHHTQDLTTNELIVRRGESFSISLKFNEPYKPKNHELVFTAATGSLPDETKGTKCVFGIPDVGHRPFTAKAVWKVAIDKSGPPSGKDTVALTMTPPADAPVGKYKLFLNQRVSHKELGTLAILFNPWCPEDDVFMVEEEGRQEYVLNEWGIIYRGSSNYISPLFWDYGQFEDGMVDICLRLLNMVPKHFEDLTGDESCHGDPIYVGRVVSAMVNSAGDSGVLEGKWSGHYWDGVHPSHWSGSYPILKRWYNSNCRAVKYGQCWVFAGVMCSVMRLLGIPCRVITNFSSAHDSNKNLTIDVYRSASGVREVPTNDSVWNFHVWVEAWMSRPDLPSGLHGWQVLDPTPQERSDGVYCCGPAPVKAVLTGLTDLDFDVPFVFAEVNADRILWMVKADGTKTMMATDTVTVGQNISTKSRDSFLRKDVTEEYKFQEGTRAERAVFKYAVKKNESEEFLARSFASVAGGDAVDGTADRTPTPRLAEMARSHTIDVATLSSDRPHPEVCMEPTCTITVERVESDFPEVFIKIQEVSKPVNGQDVKLNLVLQSKATWPRPLSIDISVKAKRYTGIGHKEIQSELKQETLQPGKALRIPVVVPFSKYWKAMLDYDAMNVCAIVTDTKDSEVYLAEEDVVLVDPPIELKVLNEAEVKEKLYAEMAFTNPVEETLKKCTFIVSGSGLLDDEVEISVPDLKPKNRVRVKVYFCPYKFGKKTLSVDFNCSVFRDIKSVIPVKVKAPADS